MKNEREELLLNKNGHLVPGDYSLLFNSYFVFISSQIVQMWILDCWLMWGKYASLPKVMNT